jgi:hypothetical protein
MSGNKSTTRMHKLVLLGLGLLGCSAEHPPAPDSSSALHAWVQCVYGYAASHSASTDSVSLIATLAVSGCKDSLLAYRDALTPRMGAAAASSHIMNLYWEQEAWAERVILDLRIQALQMRDGIRPPPAAAAATLK